MLDIMARIQSMQGNPDLFKVESQLPDKPIYTADLETDPFAYQQMIVPFSAGLYDGTDFSCYWERNPVKRLYEKLATLPAGIVYFHNLGGFDFFWMLPYFTGESTIRNGRIVATWCKAAGGKMHEVRDSYAIMPFPLATYTVGGKKKKKDIDINKLKAAVRKQHRDEIVEYLRMDCVALHELVTRFLGRFGDKLTVGSTAMAELMSVHDFIRMKDQTEDETIRSKFFFGGRVQCFEAGVIDTPFKVYDVNSMYPFVMKTYLHPVSRLDRITQKITDDTCFLEVEGWNHGAFAARQKDGGLNFNQTYGVFGVSIHEYRVAREHGLFDLKRIHACYNFKIRRTFADFVNKFYNLRIEAKQNGDDILAIFYKFILNSAYGKFAQDSDKYFDYVITDIGESLVTPGECFACRDDECSKHWRPAMLVPECGITIWKRNNAKPSYYNVATGSSITGAARSVLLHAIANADRPLYCDTDSLICRNLSGVDFSNSTLGAWKLEAQGNTACIAGKKLYALYEGDEKVKQANKGCDISAKEIRFLAECCDHEILYEKQSPTLKLDGTYTFIHRRIRRTV